MGEEVPRWVQEASRAEFKRLDDIARMVASKHGFFLKTFADAWLVADKVNKRLLGPVWVKLIGKYGLHKEFESV
ncbi:hypothetical protein ES702_03847 [subsurface metagenome]